MWFRLFTFLYNPNNEVRIPVCHFSIYSILGIRIILQYIRNPDYFTIFGETGILTTIFLPMSNLINLLAWLASCCVVFLVNNFLWFVINFSDKSQTASTKAFFSQLNTKYSCIETLQCNNRTGCDILYNHKEK